jgi:hypothetical protein
MKNSEATAKKLADMYTDDFGGKPSGRYRISRKLICEMAGQRRLYEEDVTSLARALLEHGFVLIDMESFFVVISANAFVNYRRVSKEAGRS